MSYDAPPPPPGEPTPESGATPPPPPASYGAPPPPPPSAYPPAGYGQPAPAGGPYVEWVQRVLAYLVDAVPIVVIYIIGFILAKASVVFLLLAIVVVVAYSIWNRWIMMGRTGQSLGKKVIGIKLVSEQTGQPIGPGMAFVRDLAHTVDSIICYVGWFFPLWDAKKQTIADKIMGTIVIPGDKQEFSAAIKSSMPNS